MTFVGKGIKDGCYFDSNADANEWLDFDALDEEVEVFADRDPDRFAEWQARRTEDVIE